MKSKHVALGVLLSIVATGSAIKEDLDANVRFYEKALSTEDIVLERVGNVPASVGVLKIALARHSR